LKRASQLSKLPEVRQSTFAAKLGAERLVRAARTASADLHRLKSTRIMIDLSIE
jgi:hypothetical protein